MAHPGVRLVICKLTALQVAVARCVGNVMGRAAGRAAALHESNTALAKSRAEVDSYRWVPGHNLPCMIVLCADGAYHWHLMMCLVKLSAILTGYSVILEVECETLHNIICLESAFAAFYVLFL